MAPDFQSDGGNSIAGSNPVTRLKISLNAYTDFHTEDEIIEHWQSILGVVKDNINAVRLNSISKYSKNKRCGFLEWGTCKLMVHSTEILQKIYGVIDAYSESNGMKSDCTSEMRL